MSGLEKELCSITVNYLVFVLIHSSLKQMYVGPNTNMLDITLH